MHGTTSPPDARRLAGSVLRGAAAALPRRTSAALLSSTSRSLRIVAGASLAFGVLGAAAPAATGSETETDQAYRYWGYFHLTDGTWSYADVGPAQFTPADGAVDGWRYALVAASSTRTPRGAPAFEEVCGQTPVEEGKKRVAVVIDYGREADRPSGGDDVPSARAHCAAVDLDANSAQALATVAPVREGDSGLICSVGGYPSVGCTGPVAAADVPPAAIEPDSTIQIAIAAEQPNASLAATSAADPTAPSAEADQPGEAGDPAISEDTTGPLGWLVGLGLVAAIGALLATRLRQSRAGQADPGQNGRESDGNRPESG